MTPPFPNAPVPTYFRRGQWKAAWSERNGVHYVGDDVIIDLTFATSSYDTFKRTARFDNGTDGLTISTVQRGYYSTVTAVGGAPTYSSTHAYGALAAKIPAGTDQYVEWQYANSVTGHEFVRLYLYATANPSGGVRLLNGQGHSIGVNTSGQLQIIDQGAQITTMTASIALNQWVRIEADIDHSGDIFELKMFNDPDSVSPTETTVQNPSQLPGNQVTRIGNQVGGNWGSDFWVDNVVLAASSYPGPYDPNEAIASPVTYTVRDFFGNVVSTGTFDEYQSWFQPTEPVGGWEPGWYRVYLTGAQSDANFASSYGATNFCVIRSDSHFVAMPVASTPDGSDSAIDLVMKGVMGMGTSRISVTDAANPDIPTLQSDIAITRAYWADVADTDRPTREPWIDFPNGTSTAPQQAGVTAVVAALYPDCKYFEGPSNEPSMGAGTAALMQTFADAVHAGHADAQAIGPAFVQIGNLSGWDDFLNAGGGDACDGISFHAYNAVTNGDMNLGKYTIQAFLDLLASYGLQGKPLWQTESVHGFTPVYGVYHPRRARKPLMETLLFEQKGIPRERNNQWYDVSNGFWDFPSWIENGDGSLEPQAVLTRVLAEETWGKPFSHALDFGIPGNSIFLGNVYEGNSGTTVVLMATSFIEDAAVQLTLNGAGSSVTVVDGFGNATLEDVSRGHVHISLTEVPVYVRLPAGATAGIRSVNDWPVTGIGSSLSPSATTKEINAVSYPVIADNAYMTDYGVGTGIAPATYAEPGHPVDILWDTAQAIRRVLIWCGPSWQSSGTLVEFTIETTTDGLIWTPRKTVSKDTPPYFLFGTDSTNSGCFVETYWDEQWVFDLLLDEEVLASGLRLNVTASSYGGEPLSDEGGQFGQGAPVEAFRIQEVGVFSVGEIQTVVRGGGAPPKGLRKRKAGDGEVTYQSYIILSG